MSNEIKVILYSTDHCTLCEQALDLLLSMPELAGRQLDVVDVALDDTLQSRYGERLPVLCVTCGAIRAELAWPFDAKVVAAAIRQAAASVREVAESVREVAGSIRQLE